LIAKLKGLIDTIGENHLILDVNGVGYRVFASSRTLGLLGGVGEAISLHIETNIKEDHFHLYGFLDEADLKVFRLLQTVQGVGAKVALGIQTVLSPEELQSAIVMQDKAMVSRANGVGPKLALRIVNELKDKVAQLAVSAAGMSMPSHAGATAKTPANTNIADAVSALSNLGYRPTDAHTAVVKANVELGEDAKLDDLVRLGLKELTSK
jgi:Holliday junction DNA helicase RuvA